MMNGNVEDESKSQRNFREWCESDQVRARETSRSIVRAFEWDPKKHGGVEREKENSDFWERYNKRQTLFRCLCLSNKTEWCFPFLFCLKSFSRIYVFSSYFCFLFFQSEFFGPKRVIFFIKIISISFLQIFNNEISKLPKVKPQE